MDLVEALTQNMGDFSQSTLNWVNNIVAKSTREVGLYLVGILLVLEIAKMFEKANSSNAGIVTLKMFQGLSFSSGIRWTHGHFFKCHVKFYVIDRYWYGQSNFKKCEWGF